MNDMRRPELEEYYREAETWAEDRTTRADRSRRTAWIVAGIAAAVALLEAIALVVLLPLRTVEPYTLLVDRQTGHVEALEPLRRETIAPDAALTRSFLVQYVIARESFDIDSLQADYRKVGLWSAGEARERYIRTMQAGNPESPLTYLPRRAVVEVTIRSVSSLSPGTSMVRFTTRRTDPGATASDVQYWAAVLRWQFTGAAMSEADRLLNPLGFQVVRYRRNAEALPEVLPQVPASQGAGRP